MDWLFGGGGGKTSSSTPSKENKKQEQAVAAVRTFKQDIQQWIFTPYASIPLTCAGVLGITMAYRRFLRRIPSADYVTPRTLASRSSIRGYVTSVGDADNFRVFHTPAPWPLSRLQRIPKDKKSLKDNTLHIRLAGVDAPEVTSLCPIFHNTVIV